MGFLINLMLAVLLFVAGMLLIGYLVLRVAFCHLKGAAKHFSGRQKQEVPEDHPDIIDAEVHEEVIVHEHTEDEKKHLTAKALSTALSSAGSSVGSFNEEYGSFANLIPQTKDRETKAELFEIMRTLKSINTIFEKSNSDFSYTKNLLAKCLSGADILLTDEPQTPIKFTTGIRYAAKYIQTYLLELSLLANMTLNVNNTLTEDLQSLLHNLERLRWLCIAYPDTDFKNSDIIENMLRSLSHKLQMCVSIKDFGISNRESADLIQTITVTIKDLDTAVVHVLENALSWDLLKADVDLETLRRELRLRGL